MQELVRLQQALYLTRSAAERTAAISESLRISDRQTAAWLIYFLTGKKLKKIISTNDLIDNIRNEIDLPDWLWKASLQATGDILETLALLRGRLQGIDQDPPLSETGLYLNKWNESRLAELHLLFDRLSPSGLRILFQILTGRAIFSGLEAELTAALQHVFRISSVRSIEWLFEDWKPHEIQPLLARNKSGITETTGSFAVVESIQPDKLDQLLLSDYFYESCLTGKRILIKKDRFDSITCFMRRMPLPYQQIKPLAELAELLPLGSEVEGILEVYRNKELIDEPKIISSLLQGNKSINYKLIIYDLLELENNRYVRLPLCQRKILLSRFGNQQILPESCYLVTGQEVRSRESLSHLLQTQANRLTRGIILKHKQSTYNDAHYPWLHIPLPDRSLHAVLIYVQLVSITERCAILTLGIPEQNQFFPVVSIEYKFSVNDWKNLLHFISNHKVDKHGPVIQVKPERVYELTYSSIKINKRKKAGLELVDARINEPSVSHPVECAKKLVELKREWMIV